MSDEARKPHWWWISFSSQRGTRGHKGIIVAFGTDILEVLHDLWEKGLNPGGWVAYQPIDDLVAETVLTPLDTDVFHKSIYGGANRSLEKLRQRLDAAAMVKRPKDGNEAKRAMVKFRQRDAEFLRIETIEADIEATNEIRRKITRRLKRLRNRRDRMLRLGYSFLIFRGQKPILPKGAKGLTVEQYTQGERSS